jgi:hypothetical protein
MFLAAPRPRDVDDARLRARMRRGSALTSAVAGAAVSGLVLAAVIAPTGFAASASAPYGTSQYASASATQDIELALGTSAGSDRAGFTAEAPPPPPGHTAPAAGIPDPGSAQAYAQGRVAQYGWPAREFDCLVALWNRESHWNAFSHNTSSGAYGIPQALPGEKMASAGADWATNYKTQVEWGLGYILGRYGSPCLAWQHSEDEGWY